MSNLGKAVSYLSSLLYSPPETDQTESNSARVREKSRPQEKSHMISLLLGSEGPKGDLGNDSSSILGYNAWADTPSSSNVKPKPSSQQTSAQSSSSNGEEPNLLPSQIRDQRENRSQAPFFDGSPNALRSNQTQQSGSSSKATGQQTEQPGNHQRSHFGGKFGRQGKPSSPSYYEAHNHNTSSAPRDDQSRRFASSSRAAQEQRQQSADEHHSRSRGRSAGGNKPFRRNYLPTSDGYTGSASSDGQSALDLLAVPNSSDSDTPQSKVRFTANASFISTPKNSSITGESSNSSATQSYTRSTSANDQDPQSTPAASAAISFLRDLGVSVNGVQNEQPLNDDSINNEVAQSPITPEQTEQNEVIETIFSISNLLTKAEEKKKEGEQKLEGFTTDIQKSLSLMLEKEGYETMVAIEALSNVNLNTLNPKKDLNNTILTLMIAKIQEFINGLRANLINRLKDMEVIDECINSKKTEGPDFEKAIKSIYNEYQANTIIYELNSLNANKKQIVPRRSSASVLRTEEEASPRQITAAEQAPNSPLSNSQIQNDPSGVVTSSNRPNESNSKGKITRLFGRNSSKTQLTSSY